MNPKKLLLAGTAVAATALGLRTLHRVTHPTEARVPEGSGARRRPVPDHLFDMPEVSAHDIDTPDGGTIHVVERGEGRPLVLLHGVTLRSDVWAPQFHQLADRYRVIAVDLRGHGASRVGSDGLGLPRLAADLATTLEALDLHDAIVVGHSMGGMTVMRFCGDFPAVLAERVAGLVFVATRAHQNVHPLLVGPARAVVARGQGRVAAGRALPSTFVLNDRLVRSVFGTAPSPRAVGLVTEMGRSMAPEALLGSVGGLLDHDARDALRATDTPSVVVVGTRDTLTPVPSARHLARLLPDCDFVLLPRAGHQLMQERPDELAEIIDGFVARLEGDAATLAEAVADDGGPVDADQVERPGPAAGA